MPWSSGETSANQLVHYRAEPSRPLLSESGEGGCDIVFEVDGRAHNTSIHITTRDQPRHDAERRLAPGSDVFDRLDFLVVQDLYATTETAVRADLVLPAAGWGEKDGTFINSERRIGVVRRVSPAPGEALADFWIFKLIAEAWGCADMFAAWDSPEATFRILARLSAGQPCDFSGVTGYAMLDELGGVQWPLPEGSGPRESMRNAERRLFTDGRFFTPDGRARFVFEEPRPPAEATSRRYPFVLLTGRGTSSQWHTQTRTAKSPTLRALYPAEPYVEIHPTDAKRLGILPHAWVVVRSARGRMRAKAFVTPTVAVGQVFVPMHYPETNRLTHATFDPYSRQPSYKHCAVDVHLPEAWEHAAEWP